MFPSEDRLPAIAVFNADIDFSNYEPGFLSYRVYTTPEMLARATDAVMAIRQYAQELPNFQATWTSVVTWHDTVPFNTAIPDPPAVSLKMTLCSHAAGALDKCFHLPKVFLHNFNILCLYA